MGVCQRHFPRVSRIKTVFPRGLGQVFQRSYWLGPVRVSFPEGSWLENWFPKGDFWNHPPGIPVFSGPKMTLENCLLEFKAVTSCSTHKIDQQETDG